VQQEYGTGFLLCAALAVVGARVAMAVTGQLWVPVAGRIEVESVNDVTGGNAVFCLGPPGAGYHAWATDEKKVFDASLWQFGKQGVSLPDYGWGESGELEDGLGLRYFAFPRETAMVRELGRDNREAVTRMTAHAMNALERV
jgi:hypothetical protein